MIVKSNTTLKKGEEESVTSYGSWAALQQKTKTRLGHYVEGLMLILFACFTSIKDIQEHKVNHLFITERLEWNESHQKKEGMSESRTLADQYESSACIDYLENQSRRKYYLPTFKEKPSS